MPDFSCLLNLFHKRNEENDIYDKKASLVENVQLKVKYLFVWFIENVKKAKLASQNIKVFTNQIYLQVTC